ncbi:hypothetical protein [Streptomyces sp. NPDC007063]|uniref:hypothetical protein n=1 Tax=Streptomyces sp. NPDC007063 TaxID=3364772 RepID=UPI0036BB204E
MPPHPDQSQSARPQHVKVIRQDGFDVYTLPAGQALAPYEQPVDAIELQPGAQLIPGPQGQPAYWYPQHPAPAPRQGADPRLLNLALIVGIVLAVCFGLWLAAAFIAALAELVKAVALLLLVAVGGYAALKVLAGGRLRVDVESTTGRGRRRHHTRVRVRR